MKRILPTAVSINSILLFILWNVAIPKVMAVDLESSQNGVYTSEIFHLPLQVTDAELNISVVLDTYLRISCEIRAGSNFVRFHLNNVSLSYHFEFDVLEFFGSLTSRDVSLTVAVDTDGEIQGTPTALITYYGLW